MNAEERVAELEAETVALREQVATLAAQVHELQARLAKDSHDSSNPPASDGLARKTKSLRRRSGKKPGGQVGHRGETLRLVALPDAVVVEHQRVVDVQKSVSGAAERRRRAGSGTRAAAGP